VPQHVDRAYAYALKKFIHFVYLFFHLKLPPRILYIHFSIRAPRRATLFMPRAARAYAFAGESDFWHVGAAFFIMAGSRLYKRALVFSTALERG
jgi:hypothetical protein